MSSIKVRGVDNVFSSKRGLKKIRTKARDLQMTGERAAETRLREGVAFKFLDLEQNNPRGFRISRNNSAGLSRNQK